MSSGSHSLISHQDDHWYRSEEEPQQMAERMSPKRCEDIQFLLGMVQGMHPPKGCEPVVSPMCQPIAGIHECDSGRQ